MEECCMLFTIQQPSLFHSFNEGEVLGYLKGCCAPSWSDLVSTVCMFFAVPIYIALTIVQTVYP